ncbi:MAG: hypothetical protein FWC03_04605 [Treponema sp.]|nr:hypothetical protein [Treponema sp.]
MDNEQTENNNEQLTKGEEQTGAEKRRPNANYNLSHPESPPDLMHEGSPKPGAEENLLFHYSRERRLVKAPQAVKDLYSEKKQTRFNLFKPLVADRPRAVLFGSIIFLCAMILFFSNTGFFDSSYILDGNRIDISGTRFENATILVLKKSVRTGIASITASPYSGAVDIAVSPTVNSENDNSQVFYHRVFFTMDKAEEYRFAVPFDVPDLLVVLQSEKSDLQFKLKTE